MSGLHRVCRAVLQYGRDCTSYSIKWIASYQPKYWIHYRQPRVVFVTGMPRSGTTLAKRYLGEHPKLNIAPHGTYQDGWAYALESQKGKITIFKNTRNMPLLNDIYAAYGNHAWFLCMVRDPRDELMSLFETDIHPEIPRDEMFWSLWKERHLSFFDFARISHKAVRVALMRYEDLVLNPGGTKATFLNWLKLPLAELHPTYTIIPEIAQGPRKGEDWKTHQHNNVHTSSLGLWRQEDNTKRLKVLLHYRQEEGVIELMSVLGYGEKTTDPTIRVDGLTLLR